MKDFPSDEDFEKPLPSRLPVVHGGDLSSNAGKCDEGFTRSFSFSNSGRHELCDQIISSPPQDHPDEGQRDVRESLKREI